MRVVSMVPSWTETLIEAGVDIVGRTRFCIHPDGVNLIPSVGGTKDWDFQKILSLKPDLLILDQEENPKFMGEQMEIPFIASHITKIADIPEALQNLSIKFGNQKLNEFASRWQRVITKSDLPPWEINQELPGLIEWGNRPTSPIKKIIYVIWKNPWMTVSKDTFIGSVLTYQGFGNFLETYPKRYPQIDLENIPDKDSTLILFSSEPYPFLKKRQGLDELGCSYAFMDGESFSWFGLRSLRFLEG